MFLKPTVILRQSALFGLYTTSLVVSLWLSYQLRFDFRPGAEYFEHFGLILVALVSLKLILLLVFGQFGSLLSYFGVHDVQKIFAATFLSALAALAVWAFGGIAWAPPRAVILTDLMISFLALCSIRMGFRLVREGYFNGRPEIGAPRRQVAIIGAGDVGASVAKDFIVRRGLGMKPMAFFDDDQRKWRTSIHGVTVVGAPESIPDFLRITKLDEVVIAMPSATGKRVQEIVRLLTRHGLKFEIVPSVEQLVTGKVRVSQIRAVEIQDLLGRTAISLEADRIRRLVQGNVVMVTGAGGSIGSELCRQIASYDPQRLVLIERCEVQLFQIEQELVTLGYQAEIVPLVADILDEARIRSIMERFSPRLVFHAAAHKHVPLMEHQPSEAVRNNTMGTRKLADLCATMGVERFVFISTDKAINPTNVMGATKRMAELYLQARQKHGTGTTKFMAVRFGNVLGSSGSVIPTFKKQIAAGGPITVTHPDVTRYFMTVNEAVGLVLQSATLGEGGEIFVLDMGRPMKIVDLARQLIELSGLEPETDIQIQFTGLRPGEKLFEEINHNTENMVPTEHPKIMRFLSEPRRLDSLQVELDQLQTQSVGLDASQLKLAIKALVPEYQPHFGSM
ncbi:MAG: nucleoside-diphosphate sugar epimerase/dehydratase [Opitutus sp.]